jgi:hypothetical protein
MIPATLKHKRQGGDFSGRAKPGRGAKRPAAKPRKIAGAGVCAGERAANVEHSCRRRKASGCGTGENRIRSNATFGMRNLEAQTTVFYTKAMYSMEKKLCKRHSTFGLPAIPYTKTAENATGLCGFAWLSSR